MEFSPELFDEVSKVLSDYKGVIKKGRLLECFNLIDCQVAFIRKNIKVLSSEKLDIYKNSINDTGFALYVSFMYEDKTINLLNVHGKALPGDKNDIPERIKQSQKIIDFMNGKQGVKIIGGDFNLNPDTKSVKMFEKAGYRNLIKDYKIENTRNKISWKNYKTAPGFVKQHFADYCFVSPEVKVKSFEVPYMEISDHLPQILEFEI
jgi:endonuclease/exonuclease/phosphatase family metal-dependent hydrolase